MKKEARINKAINTLQGLKIDSFGTLSINNSLTIPGAGTINNNERFGMVSCHNTIGWGKVSAEDMAYLHDAKLFVDNYGSSSITVNLLMQPISYSSVYFEDAANTDVVILAGSKKVMSVDTCAKNVVMEYNTGFATASFDTYFYGKN